MKIYILVVLALGLFACEGSGKQASENLNADSGLGGGFTQSSSQQFQMKSNINVNVVEAGTQRSSSYILVNGSI